MTDRQRAIAMAKEAHRFWLTHGIKPRGATLWLQHTEEGTTGDHYVWMGTVPGTRPLPVRQYVVELTIQGKLIAAYNQAG